MLIGPQFLPENLKNLRARMAGATVRAGRSEDCVTLLAVSKGQPAEMISAAMQLGLRDFGENYLQEALPKIDAVDAALTDASTGPIWHFIGQLQSNKTRTVAERFDWVHTVDRLRIAERLSAQRSHHAPRLNVCIQVQLAPEANKGGVAVADVAALAAAIQTLPRLRLRGLMCIPPAESGFDAQLLWFEQLAGIQAALNRTGAALDTLSMGMSADLEAAIVAGSTLVRIGTALFGTRPVGGESTIAT